MSLSLVVNLPGLAVTPMLGTLETVFPGTTQIEEQLLTVLPNLLIIPFVLLSGKLSLTRHKIAIVVWALIIYSACGVAYLFSQSMTMLIVVSCVLGCGAGMLIPFSTGLIADTFYGKYRMKEMGWQSGLSNMTLVLATYAVGWLSHGNWHLPFLVYLVPLIPLLLTFGLKQIPTQDLIQHPATTEAPSDKAQPSPAPTTHQPGLPTLPSPGGKVVNGFYISRIWGLIAVYFFISFATVMITLYCPFLIEKKDWSTSLSGTVTSLYFLFIFIPGFGLTWIVKILKGSTFAWCAVMMTLGLACFVFLHDKWSMCIGASLAGLGYGICQPLLYNKASRAVVSDAKSTLSLSFVLASNYLAIVCTPFIIDFFRGIFHVKPDGTFAFLLGFIGLVVYTVIAIWKRKSFAFSVTKDFYS